MQDRNARSQRTLHLCEKSLEKWAFLIYVLQIPTKKRIQKNAFLIAFSAFLKKRKRMLDADAFGADVLKKSEKTTKTLALPSKTVLPKSASYGGVLKHSVTFFVKLKRILAENIVLFYL